MAEVPEIRKISMQMNGTLKGKIIQSIEVMQGKCLNVSVDELKSRVESATIESVSYRGKWIITTLNKGESLLLSLGMGADVFYYESEALLANKYHIRIMLTDNTGCTIRFWWFGKLNVWLSNYLYEEPNTKDIAIDPYHKDFTLSHFKNLMMGKKKNIKSLLLDQKVIGGIGNAYAHDILFKAEIHPLEKAHTIGENRLEALYYSIIEILNMSYEKGAFAYEPDFFGNKGNYSMDDFLVGYKENQPCPKCTTSVITIKTGSTTSFIFHSVRKNFEFGYRR